MSRRLQFRRAPSATVAAYTPAEAELWVATDTKKLHLGDGVTAGGIPLARDDHNHPVATSGASGFMSAADKVRLDALSAQPPRIVTSASTAGDRTVAASDYGRLIRLQGASNFTLTFATAGSSGLGAGFYCRLRAEGAAIVTLDPSGSETINGAATYAMRRGQTMDVFSDGTNFVAILGGHVVGSAYAAYTLNADLPTQTPFDDTFPQSNEGTQILSLDYTMFNQNNALDSTFDGMASWSGGAAVISSALFLNADVSAFAAEATTTAAASAPTKIHLRRRIFPNSSLPLTISARVGSNVTIRLNGTGASRIFGGAAACILSINEVMQ
jgi:hypothetical protein